MKVCGNDLSAIFAAALRTKLPSKQSVLRKIHEFSPINFNYNSGADRLFEERIGLNPRQLVIIWNRRTGIPNPVQTDFGNHSPPKTIGKEFIHR